MSKILLLIALLASMSAGPGAVFESTVHDFGKVTVADGPLSCTFTVTNDGDDTLYIRTVVSSCGCTSVTWTRTGIAPGESGVIEATFSNDEGPYPFDKVLTVYTTADSRPVILHLRGIVKKK